MTGLGRTVDEPIREDDGSLEPRPVKCVRCVGTGLRGPRRRGNTGDPCPACLGDGKVLETHAWAGYECTLDFTVSRNA